MSAASASASPAYAGVVPAAGASRRMGGQPKALLTLEGRTFLERAVAALAEGGCDPVLAVVPEGASALARAAAAAGADVLTNPDPGEGPITSLRLALRTLSPEVAGVVYLHADRPLVRADTVRALLADARATGAALTLPVYCGERGHPSVLGRSLFAELLDPDLEGGARTVVHRHLAGARLVEVSDPGILADIDTPEAYAEARRGRTGLQRRRAP